MKKFVVLLVTFFILAISGCDSDRVHDIIERMEFNQAVGTYTINIDESESNVPSILLFGSSSNLTEDMLNRLNDSVTSITLSNEKRDRIKFNPENIEWKLSDPNLLKDGFSLRLTSNNLSKSIGLVFDEIIIDINKRKVKRELNPLYLQYYSGEQNGISIMESPLAPKNKVILGKEYSYSYKVLDSNHIITSDIRVELLYPDEVRNFIEIVNVEINPDLHTEEQIKEEYKDKLDEKKLNGIKVYEIQCTYTIKRQGTIVFQPEIKLLFDKFQSTLAPLEPISFLNFVDSQ